MKSFLLFFLLFIFLCKFSTSTEPVGKPKLVIELFRHGARGPLHHQGDSHWRGKEGKLTEVGKAQHFVLGAKLLKRYPHLERVINEPQRMFLRSTDYSRTIESLKHHLWGMFFSKSVDVDEHDIYHPDFYKNFKNSDIPKNYFSHEKLKQQEVQDFIQRPIYIAPHHDDLELFITESSVCPNVGKLLEPEDRYHLEGFMSQISQTLRDKFGFNLKAQGIHGMFDYQIANLFEGRPMTFGLTPDSDIWKYIKAAGEYYFTFKRLGSARQRTILGTPLVNHIASLLEGAKDELLPYELVLLSGHEVTLMNFLGALSIIRPECIREKLLGLETRSICHSPGYASSILIELWEKDGTHQVRMLYDGEPIPFCGNEHGFCDYDFVKEAMDEAGSQYTMEEVHHYCGRETGPEYVSEDKSD